MDQLFLKVINMSMTTSYVILLIILIRLLLKRVPKVYSYVLWIIVLFRLLVPFSVSSVFSMIPMSTNPIPADIMYAAKPEIHSGITPIDRVVNNSLATPVVATSVNPIQVWLLIGKYIWLAGMLILLIYSILSTLKLTKQLKSSKHLRGNIYLVNHIETPFVFGLLRPKIYLPFGLSEIEESYIIKHEETHIKRFDHIIKFTFFIATAIHWFNPLVWLAFFLMSKDMELSCDEKVISEMGSGIKKDYSHSLLSLSSSKRIIGSSPLAFGGENTKGRVKNILNYKKPRFWVTLVGIIVIGASVIGLLSNPKPNGLLAAEEGKLIKGFLENYYGQLAYSEEEQEDIEKEMAELSSIISLNGEIDTPSGEVRPNGFYYFYKESLTPELYSAMVRNRKIPDLNMIQMGFLKSEITDLKLKKEKNIIHANFKVACYGAESVIEEKAIELDFILEEIKGKIYIDTIIGDLNYIPMGYENQVYPMAYGAPEIKKDTNLGAELPFIVYESNEQVIFYNYMGIFVYDIKDSKMSHAIKLLDPEFTKTQGDKSTIVNYDIKEKIINIYQVGLEIPNSFYKFHLTSDRLDQHLDEFVEGEGQYEATGKMDTTDWTAWNLIYISDLTGETYYPFRSIIK